MLRCTIAGRGLRVKRNPSSCQSPISLDTPSWSETPFAWRSNQSEKTLTILTELDAEKRTTLQHEMGQRLYAQYHGVMLGMKATTWALSKKVGAWSTLLSVPLENNYAYVTPV